MNKDKSKSANDIFADMHQELRYWNQDIPESSDRLDPVLRIMLKLYASQLAEIDKKVDQTWDVASQALIKSLCPESLRWPIPAFTIMRAEPTDPIVEVDPQTRFFYKEERDDGQTFFFSSIRKERLVQTALKNIYFVSGGSLLDLSPQPPESTQVSPRPARSAFTGPDAAIYIALEHDGPATDFNEALLFLKGQPDALKQLRWGNWLPGIGNDFNYSAKFCPGFSSSIDKMFSVNGTTLEWGGLRRSSDLFKPLEDNLINIPSEFTKSWTTGAPDATFRQILTDHGIDMSVEAAGLYWIKIILPPGGDKSVFQSSFELYSNCFIALNKNDLTLFKHTGGNRLIEIELPEDIGNILEIVSVIDSNGVNYIGRHEALSGQDDHYYTMEERRGKLILWFDFSSAMDLPPDSITVNYSVTAGTEANGISAGKIKELYENHPGLASFENIMPVNGAIPAKTKEQIMTEVSARLRGRDRALTFEQIGSWATAFDRRIIKAECEKGVQLVENGVRKCIVVKTTVKGDQFYSDEEQELLRRRLQGFLKARSSVNSQFELEIIKK